MPSSALCLRDLRALHQLIQECRDRGDDPVVWRDHLCERIGRLTTAGGDAGGPRSGRARGLGIADWGWGIRCDRAGSLRSVVEFDPAPAAGPAGTPAADWDRAHHYRTYYATAGLGLARVCFREPPGCPGEFSGVLVSRALGAREFSGRDRAVLAEVYAAIVPLVGGVLARFAEPAPGDLPPRVRQVLRRRLEGDGDKQAAARLGISPHTVDQYVKHVFAHFGVNTRPELLSRWVRRGWGGRFAWAD